MCARVYIIKLQLIKIKYYSKFKDVIDGFRARTMITMLVMPTTTVVEDLLKHFGTRYYR